MTEERDAPVKCFAERLQLLFSVVRDPSGRLYNVSQVADAINADGYVLSRAYLSALREGTRPIPKPHIVEAISKFFDVPPAYFYDDQVFRWMEEDIRLLVSLRDSGIRSVSFHASGLSRESLKAIVDIVKHFRKMQGLPESPEDEPTPKRRRRMRPREDGQETSNDAR